MAYFSHLNVHSEYSIMESTVKIGDLINATIKKGMNAVALTDRYVMSGIIKFYEEAAARNIKPIAGCEVCINDRGILSNLILLIMNREGYENLCELVSRSYLEKTGPEPVIKFSDLKEMSGGLVGLTCFTGGEVSLLVKAGETGEALLSVSRYQKIFKDNFFLEVQRCRKKDQYLSYYPETIINFAISHNIPIVATNNVHYLDKQDYGIYRYLFKIKTMQTKSSILPELLESDQYYLKSPSEMTNLFNDIPEAISNIGLIVERCNFKPPLSDKSRTPCASKRENKATRKKLIRLCFKNGLGYRYKNNPPGEAVSRLKKELSIIIQMGFCMHFIIAAEIADFARKNNIPLCGKGSSAGSIVSYLLGISDIDPVTNNLYFERFLNKEREKTPDIDIDISGKRRDLLVKHLVSIYGKTGISRVCTFSTMKKRASLREAGRILGYGSEEISEIINEQQPHLLSRPYGRYNDNNYKGVTYNTGIKTISNHKMACISEKIRDYPRHVSVHPSAFVISSSRLERKIPLFLSETGEITSQYDISSIEKLGLTKIDLISSLTLSLIDDLAGMLKNERNINLDISNIKYNDSRVFNLIKNGRTLGVFQLESYGIRKLAIKIKPSSIEDIMHLISLYRPAPASTGMVEKFIMRKHGIEKISCLHKDLEPILNETYGTILYQEQVMKIAVKIAGYSFSEADNLRKAISCISMERIKDEEKKFIEGAAYRRYPADTAREIFKSISRFTSYSFVKAHAAAYARLSYKICYIKTYYPAELISFILTHNSGYYDKARYIEEARRLGIKIKLPDINKSGFEFTVEDEGKSIRISLLTIKELGHIAAKSILEERTINGEFKNLYDFYCRTSKNFRITEKAAENLIKTGAFDFAETNRKKLLFYYHYLKNTGTGKNTCHDREVFPCPVTSCPEDFNLEEKLSIEEKILGFCASRSPLYYFISELKKYNIIKSNYFSSYTPKRVRILTAGIVISRKIKKNKDGKGMLFCTMEDEGGMYEVLFPPDTCKKTLKIVINNSFLIIGGRLSFRKEGLSLIGSNAISLTDLKKSRERKRKDVLKYKLLARSDSLWRT
jgi:DNA polymerase III subunit alpha